MSFGEMDIEDGRGSSEHRTIGKKKRRTRRTTAVHRTASRREDGRQ